jgi:phosphoribosylformylglycinamidine synthase
LEKHSLLPPENIHAIFVPGGFSYGDYLRAGAFAARSPEMAFVKQMAKHGVPILGICNGFQILCESGLLPGALVKNITGLHHHFPVSLKINPQFLDRKHHKKCAWIPQFEDFELHSISQIFSKEFFIPMSCGTGQWIPPLFEKQKQSAENLCVIFYNNNENGSYKAIAGVTNEDGNIFGMMPHPERASDALLGSTEGLLFLLGIAQSQDIKIKTCSPLENFITNLKQGSAL